MYCKTFEMLPVKCLMSLLSLPPQTALVGLLDARLTGDQVVVGSTSPGSATFFCGDES